MQCQNMNGEWVKLVIFEEAIIKQYFSIHSSDCTSPDFYYFAMIDNADNVLIYVLEECSIIIWMENERS